MSKMFSELAIDVPADCVVRQIYIEDYRRTGSLTVCHTRDQRQNYEENLEKVWFHGSRFLLQVR
jgi:hypothetical protein